MIAAGGEGFPRSVAALRKVPGIGDYTAGAIASIAFKEVFHIFFSDFLILIIGRNKFEVFTVHSGGACG